MRGKPVFLPLLFLISAGAGATALPPIIADADNTVPNALRRLRSCNLLPSAMLDTSRR